MQYTPARSGHYIKYGIYVLLHLWYALYAVERVYHFIWRVCVTNHVYMYNILYGVSIIL